jgi:serine/threonine-protein kinase
MGAVYMARRADGQFELTAALKLLPVGAATPQAHRRFLDERRILARLEHPNIARLYDGGVTDDGTPYFVMEYVDGLPLLEYCRRQQLGLDERIRLFLNVCDAVSFAHRKLVVHRDLKPNNIMVTAEGQVKLLDFGIARLMEPGEGSATATALGGRLMTPRYASPEQLAGEPVTTSSDLYTLGVIFHELIIGASPYEISDGKPTIVDAIRRQAVQAPSTRVARWAQPDADVTEDMRRVVAEAASMGLSVRALARRLRGDLDNILLKALRKEPERRYASVEAMAEDIRRHRDGFPVKARPEGVRYVLSRFLVRHALGVAGAVAVLVLLGTVVVMAVRFAVATREQSQEIARERDRAEEIAHFMRELFEVTNPALTDGATVTARELLDRGVDRIREDHPDEPELQAEMLTVLGTVYHHLGLHDTALDLLGQAAALQDRLPAVRPDERAATLLELGRALREAGRPADAIRVLQEAREMFRSVRGDRDRDVARASLELGRSLQRTGESVEARAELRSALQTLRALDVEPDRAYADGLVDLADNVLAQGETTEGVELLEEALLFYRQILPASHPRVTETASRIAALRSGAQANR